MKTPTRELIMFQEKKEKINKNQKIGCVPIFLQNFKLNAIIKNPFFLTIMIKKCLFCKKRKKVTREHIIPESLGNKHLVLKYVICKECNNHFSKIEDYFCNYHLAVEEKLKYLEKTKKGKEPFLPLANGGEARRKNNKITYQRSIKKKKDLNSFKMTFLDNRYEIEAQFGFPEINLQKISKFLAKCGIETLYYKKGIFAFKKEFDFVRKYALDNSDRHYIPFLWKRNSNGDINIKTCQITRPKKQGNFFYSITYLPGCEYWFPLNRTDDKYVFDFIAEKCKLKKFEEDNNLQRDNLIFKFLYS